jgi:hypothetical protein
LSAASAAGRDAESDPTAKAGAAADAGSLADAVAIDDSEATADSEAIAGFMAAGSLAGMAGFGSDGFGRRKNIIVRLPTGNTPISSQPWAP